MTENYKLIEDLARKDVAGLVLKGKAYGDSWKRRGGVGAFMMLARKWDRIENLAKMAGYDIFKAVVEDAGAQGILDDIEDLRRYLLLVQAHVESEMGAGPAAPVAAPQPAPATTLPPTSATVHQQAVKPARCTTCHAPGNHAGFQCPRTLGHGAEPSAKGYVDQD